MSADLFALFGDTSQTATPQQNYSGASRPSSNTNGIQSASDPFSFLGSGPSVTQPQREPEKPAQWAQPQQPTAGPHSTWFTSPVDESQKGSAWGDIGELGGLGGFQSQTPAFSAVQQPAQAGEDDDGWGDFEVAPANFSPQPAASNAEPNPPRARITRASTLDMMSNKLLDLGLETSTPEPWQQRPSWETNTGTPQPAKQPKPVRNPDPNVLFDADFEAESGENDDEFGDFETGTSGPVVSRAVPAGSALDLLSLDSAAPAPPKKQPPGLVLSDAALQAKPGSYPEAPRSPYGSFHERKPEPVKQLQVKPPTVTKVLREANQASPSPVTAWPSVEHDGFGSQWEEFKDLPDSATKPVTTKPASKSKPKPAAPTTPAGTSDWEWQDWGGGNDSQPPAETTITTATTTIDDKPGPPPTNIPPPATLLSLLPPLLDLASSSLLKPLLTLSPSSPSYQRVLAAEQTLTFLRGYLALATVAARLIAGRKHRWHRDRFLAQGMAISAAGAAGGGGQRGMKLASVDKSQAAHEDREAAELVSLWRGQVGRLRGVVAGVNAAAQAKEGVGLQVPEIVLGMVVSVAKGVPTAPRACVVCGLKRDERIAKVDGKVEDSFGEWWVEHWGHRECRSFWVRHERELRQR